MRWLVLFVMVASVMQLAAAETGTWGASGTARVAVSGGSLVDFDIRISGSTDAGRPGNGSGHLGTTSIAYTCARSSITTDGRWIVSASGIGTDHAGYLARVEMNASGVMVDLRVERGAPGFCEVAAIDTVWVGHTGAFYANEGGVARLAGSGAFIDNGDTVTVDIDAMTAYASGGTGTFAISRNAQAPERFDIICGQSLAPTMEHLWFDLLGISDDGEMILVFVQDTRRRTDTSGDLIAIDVQTTVDRAPTSCSLSSNYSAPRPLSSGNFVTAGL